MSVTIRYITGWPGGDPYICHGNAGGGAWVTKSRNGTPMEFADEAKAKAFLLANDYDLNPLQTFFEAV